MKRFFLPVLLLLAGLAFGLQADAADKSKVDIRTMVESTGVPPFVNEFYVVDAQGQIVTEMEEGVPYQIAAVGQYAPASGYYKVIASEPISPNLNAPVEFAAGDTDANTPAFRFPVTGPKYAGTVHIEVHIYYE